MPRVPTWREVADFCGRNGYERDERSHHTYYTREPVTGFISQTYLSRGAGNTRYYTEEQIAAASPEEAQRRLDDYFSRLLPDQL